MQRHFLENLRLLGICKWEKNAVADILQLKCTDTNVLISTEMCLLRINTLRFEDIQRHYVFKTKVTEKSNCQSVLNRNPN